MAIWSALFLFGMRNTILFLMAFIIGIALLAIGDYIFFIIANSK